MDIIDQYVSQFNATDNERYVNHIDNAHAARWMRGHCYSIEYKKGAPPTLIQTN